MNNVAQQPQNDEIDLIELVKVLWKKKVWIMLSAVIFTLLAGVYAFTAKEKWTSSAEVVGPKSVDLGNYLSLRKEYALITHSNFDEGALAANLYNAFDKYLYSQDSRADFFSQPETLKVLNIPKAENERETQIILAKLAQDNTTLTKPDAKKTPDMRGMKIAFSAEKPEVAQKVLNALITFSNQQALTENLNEFMVTFREYVMALEFERSLLEENLTIQRNVQIANLQKALQTAKNAGIKDNVATVNAISVASDTKIPLTDSKLSDGTYLFMLGEKALQAQLDVATSQKIVFPPRYYDIQEQLKKLEVFSAKLKDIKAQAFSYLASPNYPTVKDAPKTVLILIIGFVLGIILGMISIFASFMINNQKDKQG